MGKVIETIGYISKIENVRSIEHHILPNTLVIENVEPFPGYHGIVPSDKAPMSLFLATQQKHTFEEISRATKEIKESFPEIQTGVVGELKIFNDSYPSIRLMGLKSFVDIEKIQKAYEKFGFKFLKKKLVNDCAIIKIQKSFLLDEIEMGIYKDLDEPGTSYLKVYRKIGWDDFQKVTKNVKNNIEFGNFDAALGYFYRHKGVIDFVRIYSKTITIEQLYELKDLYNGEIKKLEFID